MVQIPIIVKTIDVNKLDYSNVEYIKNLISACLNFVENAYYYANDIAVKYQKLKDEYNKLIGEQGKPDIKPSIDNDDKKDLETDIDIDIDIDVNDDDNNCDDKEKIVDRVETVNKKKKDDTKPGVVDETSPEINEKPKKKWKKKSKKDKVKIDSEKIIEVDKDHLPDDAKFKGYVEVVIQEIEINTANTLYKLEKYYSESLKKTYQAELPPEYQGTEFGPKLKALIHFLYFDLRVTQNKIKSFLEDIGISISEGKISNILSKDYNEILTKEKEDIFEAGLQSNTYNQIDDTGFRVNGVNCYATIVCNENFCAYFINKRKNNETIKNILLNPDTNEVDFKILICDDAPQFHNITDIRALCWVHEARHYKKDLIPGLDCTKEILERKKGEIWDYYRQLLDYKENPSEVKKVELDSRFDEMFSETTGYEPLDKRLQLTLAKKEHLLAVLDNPEIPLHNNLSENGIRPIVVKRKISGGTRSKGGSISWENNMTILETCKKNGVKYFKYLIDIFSKRMALPRLADLIKRKTINDTS